jgi:hypothetical protein
MERGRNWGVDLPHVFPLAIQIQLQNKGGISAILLISNYFNPFEFNWIELVRQSMPLPFENIRGYNARLQKII